MLRRFRPAHQCRRQQTTGPFFSCLRMFGSMHSRIGACIGGIICILNKTIIFVRACSVQLPDTLECVLRAWTKTCLGTNCIERTWKKEFCVCVLSERIFSRSCLWMRLVDKQSWKQLYYTIYVGTVVHFAVHWNSRFKNTPAVCSYSDWRIPTKTLRNNVAWIRTYLFVFHVLSIALIDCVTSWLQ